jgi:hypothetical protein
MNAIDMIDAMINPIGKSFIALGIAHVSRRSLIADIKSIARV